MHLNIESSSQNIEFRGKSGKVNLLVTHSTVGTMRRPSTGMCRCWFEQSPLVGGPPAWLVQSKNIQTSHIAFQMKN